MPPVSNRIDPNVSLSIFSILCWKSGDVVVSAGPKQGTTWLLNIVHQLRTGGDSNFECLTDECPVIERPDYPAQPDQERLAVWEAGVFQRHPFRAFKTHLAPPLLPLSSEVKYIVPVRNGLDALVSQYFFTQNMAEDYRAIWGQWAVPKASMPDQLETALSKRRYWNFINAWLPHRHAPNVLMLHYADLKRDLAGNVSRVADFVGLKLAPDQWPGILEKCGFEWMRVHAGKFDPRTVVGKVKRFNEGSMIRKGVVGDHKTWLTPEQESRWQAVHKQQIPDPALRAWCDEGGELP